MVNSTYYDFVIYASVGMPYTGSTPEHEGLGGSEFETILLAEALAAGGRSVLVLNKTTRQVRERGVDYANHDAVLKAPALSCKFLLIHRYSAIPHISAERIVVVASDIPEHVYDHLHILFDGGLDATLITVSDWQRAHFPAHWQSKTIPNMLPEFVYDLDLPISPRRFVYASAALKGLHATLAAWQELHDGGGMEGAELCVCTPGYDSVDVDDFASQGVRFLGSLPFHRVAEEIAASAGLFYVNAWTETFSIVAALTEALGRRVHILYTSDPGGLPQAVRSPLVTGDRAKFLADFRAALADPENPRWHGAARDYRVSSVMPQWLELFDAPTPDYVPAVAPNTVRDQVLYAEFRHELAQLTGAGDASPRWSARSEQLLVEAAQEDARELLRWPALGDTNPGEFPVLLRWYCSLKDDAQWSARWHKLTRESAAGSPKPFSLDAGTSPLLVQHVYTYAHYEWSTGKSLKDIDCLIEFGGGFGSFARVLQTDGFSGIHIIYDLPPMGAVQRLYLRMLGIEVDSLEVALAKGRGVATASAADLAEIVEYLGRNRDQVNGLLCTWSFVETPLAVLDEFLSVVAPLCDRALIVYQPNFDGIDYDAYFSGISTLFRGNSLIRESVPDYPNNTFVMVWESAEGGMDTPDGVVVQTPHNATDYDILYAEFRNALDQLTGAVDATPHWSVRCEQLLAEAAAREGAHELLRWPALIDINPNEFPNIQFWYRSLKNDAQWSTRWRRLTRESAIGSPKQFSLDAGTSPILISHVYNYAHYERSTGKSLKDIDCLIEFGGGFGSFARMMQADGFVGIHIIYDLPPMGAVQRLYLRMLGIEVGSLEEVLAKGRGVATASAADLAEIVEYLGRNRDQVNGLLGTWSFSETSVAVRDEFLSVVAPLCDRALIAYQPRWEGIDNAAYFSTKMPQFRGKAFSVETVPDGTDSTFVFVWESAEDSMDTSGSHPNMATAMRGDESREIPISNRYKVCVYAICKNEEKFVDRWMDAVQEADVVVVLDTGSSDASVEKLRARGAQVYERIVSPWRFDTARNIAMDFVPEDVDICVSNDLDEIFEPGWRKSLEESWTPETTLARYRFVDSHRADGSAEKVFGMEKIHRRQEFRWVRPVHEKLKYTGSDPESTRWVEGIVLHHYPDHGKPRSQYMPLLELAAEENPEDGQILFWLGREYAYHGRPDDAIAILNRYLDLPEMWDLERCASARYISNCYEAKGEPDQAQAWAYRAIAECSDSREPYFHMALLAYRMNDWALVLAMVEKLLSFEDTGRSGYLREADCWGYSPFDLAGIATYWLGLYRRSYDYSAQALAMKPGDQRLVENIALAAEKLDVDNETSQR